MRSRELPILLLVTLAGLVTVTGLFLYREIALVGTLGFPLDDAWIHLTFARNFAGGLGFCFNPGEPVAGSTGPLWTILLGTGILLFGPTLIMVKALGIGLLAVSAYLLHGVLRRLGADNNIALAGTFLLVTTSRLQWAALSGMEVMLSITLILSGFLCYFRFRAGGHWGWCAGAGLFFAAAGWARPESMVLVGGPVLDLIGDLWKNRTTKAGHTAPGLAEHKLDGAGVKPSPVSALVILGGAFLLAIVPLFILNHHLSGGASYLPATFTAKTLGLSLFDRLGGTTGIPVTDLLLLPLKTLWPVVKYILLPDNLILLVFLPFAFRLQRGVTGNQPQVSPRSLLIGLLLLPALRALVTGEVANFQQYGRYLAVLTPLYLILGILGVAGRYARTAPEEKRIAAGITGPWASLTPVLIAVAALGAYYAAKRFVFGMGHQWPQAGDLWYLPILRQARPVHVAVFALLALTGWGVVRYVLKLNDGTAAGSKSALVILWLAVCFNLVEDWQVARENAWNVHNIEQTQVRLGRWLARSSPHDAVVATNDIGAIGYFSERRIIDLVGLVTPAMLESIRVFRHPEKAMLHYFEQDPPDYLVIFDSWYPGLAGRDDLLEEVWRVPILNNLTCGSPGTRDMTVYRWRGGTDPPVDP